MASPSARGSALYAMNLVGREREQGVLLDSLQTALDGHGSLALISGEAGIGKTTLVRWLISEAREHDALVMSGGCYDLTTTPPYGPWIEILRGYTGDGALPPLPDQLREGTALEGIHSQAALFELAGRFFYSVAGAQPLVLLLEDLHWADLGSLEMLRYLGRNLASHRILVLATYRDDEITRRDALFQLIPALVRESGAVRTELHGWTNDDVRSFIASQYGLIDGNADRLVAYLVDRASGNPLFVVELLRTLESAAVLEPVDGGWRVGDLSGVPVPTFVVQLIEGRLHGLDDDVRRLLEIAAVIGQEVSLDLWKQVSGASDGELSAALEGAIEAGILDEAPGGLRVHFHHALIREALYSELGILQRRDWHRAAADILLETPRPDPDEVITHLEPASDPRLLDWLIRSGDRAMSRFAWDTAVERYTRASSLLEVQETSDPVRACEALLKLGEAQNSAGTGRSGGGGAGNDPKAQATFWQVAAIARESGLAEKLGQAALGIAGVNKSASHGGPEGINLLAEALDALPGEDSALRAKLLARLATGAVFWATTDAWTEFAAVEQVDAWSSEAIAMARRLDDPRTLAYTLGCRDTAVTGRYDFGERRANFEELLALAAQTDDLPLVAWALYDRVIDMLMAGDLESASEVFDRFAAVSERLQMPILDWFAAVHRSGAFLSAGRYEDTKRGIEQVSAVWPGSLVAQAQAVALHRELGDSQTMRDHALWEARTPGMTTRPNLLVPLRLQYFLEAGEIDATRNQFESFIDKGYLSRELPKLSMSWLRVVVALAETSAALGDADRAGLIYEQLAPFDGLNIFAGYANYSMGAVAHYLGLLAATMSDWATGEQHFSQALEQNERWGLRPAAAYTRYEWAAMLQRRNQAGDRVRALELLGEARATARELGMVRLLRLATELGRKLGVSDRSHPSGLSSREVEVLQLVAQGLTNAEVGEALFISPRTVAQHLRSVYNKLGVNSRAAAVARWLEIASD